MRQARRFAAAGMPIEGGARRTPGRWHHHATTLPRPPASGAVHPIGVNPAGAERPNVSPAMTRPSHRRLRVGADPIGLGALGGLVIGCAGGTALGFTVAPQDVASQALTLLIGTFAGLLAGLLVGRIVDLRRENASLPPAHDTLPRVIAADRGRAGRTLTTPAGGGTLRRGSR